MKLIEFLNGEVWWGGTTIHAYCPITENSVYHLDLIKDARNQTMPFFVSNKGRYIWCDEPFVIDINNGVIKVDDCVIIDHVGNTLREAYLIAQKRHFPCDCKQVEKSFFVSAQYNTWIEFAYYPTQKGIETYAEDIISHGFAPGIFIIDEGWHCNTGYGNWDFDFARFPNPKGMIKKLHSLGFKVMLWVTPFVTPVGPSFVRSLNPFIGTNPEEAKKIYMRNTDGEVAIMKWWNGVSAILDFTNPVDCKFLDKQLNYLVENYGVDGFKFDGGNVEHYTDDNVINGKYSIGSPQRLNIAWNDYGRKFAFHEYKDTYKGGGKNTIERLHDRDHSWTGNGINELIPCAINAGLIGHQFICPDMIGGGEWRNRYTPGFKVDEELFVRMAQCSALFPMMQFSWAPWEALSEENTRLCLEAANLHNSMADYILKLVDESTITGEPIVRSLDYCDPGQGFDTIADEFLLGNDILVAPIVTKNTYERTVFFPQGIWRDSDGNTFKGRTKEILKAPIERLLWFSRIE